MPRDSSHAYARGKIFEDKRLSVLFPFISIFIKWFETQKAQLAWEVFKKNSIMGQDCRIGPNAWCVNSGRREDIRLGNRVFCRGLLRCGTRGNGCIFIGDEVYIGDDTIISAENYIEIGQLTMIAHGVHIIDTRGHPLDPYLREQDWRIQMGDTHGTRPIVPSAPIRIGKRVWIGFNSAIFRGVAIGDNAIIAAGSVVVEDVESNTMVAGNPACVVKKIDTEINNPSKCM
ncbi:MAG: acyltransferase [Candidatus Omnitrophota bacterium]